MPSQGARCGEMACAIRVEGIRWLGCRRTPKVIQGLQREAAAALGQTDRLTKVYDQPPNWWHRACAPDLLHRSGSGRIVAMTASTGMKQRHRLTQVTCETRRAVAAGSGGVTVASESDRTIRAP
jgi:hypothetical protein